jgi:hypothetical protein
VSSGEGADQDQDQDQSSEMRRVSQKLVELQHQLALVQRELDASRLAATAGAASESPKESEGL